jgi:GNAT superfamily N-acetyltransferase
VESADREFLLRLYASTRAAELSLTGWDAVACETFVRMQFDAQGTHYRQHWPASLHSIIEVTEGHAQLSVGRLWLDWRADTLHLLDISLLPAWCGRGIGSACLGGLQRAAALRGLPVSIHVEQGNPARKLYDRLGFMPVGPLHGIHQLMSWRSDTGAHALSFEEPCSEQA